VTARTHTGEWSNSLAMTGVAGFVAASGMLANFATPVDVQIAKLAISEP
jgi:hypothetical protein